MRGARIPSRRLSAAAGLLILAGVFAVGCSTNRSLGTPGDLRDWLEVRGDAERTGARSARAIEPPLYLAWRKKTGRSPAVEPALAGHVLIVAGTDRQVRLLETESGDTVWRCRLDGIPSTNVVVTGDRAFVGHANPEARLVAISVVNGSVLWRTKALRPTGGMVARADTLFVWDIGKGPVALDAATGEILWTADIGGRWPAPLAYSRGVLIATSEQDSIRALSSRDGSTLWAAPGFDGSVGAPAITDGIVIVPGFEGTVRALDLTSGDVRWTRGLSSRLGSAVCIVDGVAFLTGLVGRLYAIDVATGEAMWNVELDGVCRAAPARAGNALVVVTMSGTCQLVSLRERKVTYTVDLGRPVRVAPVVSGDRVFAVDDGGNAYAYESS